jgi:hypothetical protein
MSSMYQQKTVAPLQQKQAMPQEPTLQRETGPVKSPPKFGFANTGPVQKKEILSDKKLEAARAFYANNPDFTEQVIKQVQGQVGTPKTGTMDDATLQAIAKFQKSVGLTADGMLGPQTMPKLFAHGLATGEVEQEFAQEYLGVDWSSLKTAEARGKKMVGLINRHLKEAGVPECAVRVEDLGEDSGQFSFDDWTILVGNDFLSKEKLTRKQLDDFANTTIHEARHAEQWFNMAQKLAGEGKTAKQIEDEMGIPAKIARAACANPIKTNTAKFLVAKNWYESVYGSGSDHRDKTLDDDGSYEDYRNLPEEHDAWRVGDEFDVTLKKERKLKMKAEVEKKKLERKKKRAKKKKAKA